MHAKLYNNLTACPAAFGPAVDRTVWMREEAQYKGNTYHTLPPLGVPFPLSLSDAHNNECKRGGRGKVVFRCLPYYLSSPACSCMYSKIYCFFIICYNNVPKWLFQLLPLLLPLLHANRPEKGLFHTSINLFLISMLLCFAVCFVCTAVGRLWITRWKLASFDASSPWFLISIQRKEKEEQEKRSCCSAVRSFIIVKVRMQCVRKESGFSSCHFQRTFVCIISRDA